MKCNYRRVIRDTSILIATASLVPGLAFGSGGGPQGGAKLAFICFQLIPIGLLCLAFSNLKWSRAMGYQRMSTWSVINIAITAPILIGGLVLESGVLSKATGSGVMIFMIALFVMVLCSLLSGVGAVVARNFMTRKLIVSDPSVGKVE